MQIGTEGFIILSTITILCYILYITVFDDNLEAVKSTIDDREYYVQEKDDSQEAADYLAMIRQKLMLLVTHLRKAYPNDERTLLLKNFDANNLKEGADDAGNGVTSYTINKNKITLCLRNAGKLVDINTLMFVAIHELGHVVTHEIHHTPTFWSNFSWLLEESINIGIYQHQDYAKHPQEYCNMTITSNPVDMQT
jgi:hypothetical protein